MLKFTQITNEKVQLEEDICCIEKLSEDSSLTLFTLNVAHFQHTIRSKK